MIGNISKPHSIKCLPSCNVQDNTNQMSFAPYPQRRNFFYQKSFCDVASHILQMSCLDKNRKHFLDLYHPNLCTILESFVDYFGNTSEKSDPCEAWPHNFFMNYDKPDNELVKEVYEYGKNNLALIHVMIQSPHVTRIRRDVAMTFTGFVANAGKGYISYL